MKIGLTCLKGTSKNLSFDHLILYPSPKGEGQAEFLEVPLISFQTIKCSSGKLSPHLLP